MPLHVPSSILVGSAYPSIPVFGRCSGRKHESKQCLTKCLHTTRKMAAICSALAMRFWRMIMYLVMAIW